MKKVKQVLVCFLPLIALFLGSCSKSGTSAPEPYQPKGHSISSISPQNLTNGSQFIITGTNFGTDINQVKVTLDNQYIVVKSVSPTTITATIPDNLVASGSKSFSLRVSVEDYLSNILSITVTYNEPTGWFYAATIPGNSSSFNPTYKLITFPTENVGYIHKERYIYRSADGGLTWEGNTLNGNLGQGYAFYSFDGDHNWVDYFGDIYYTTVSGTNWSGYTRLDTITSIPYISNNSVRGLYMSAPSKGYVLKGSGRLFYINGSFAPKDITLAFQSLHAPANPNSGGFQKLSVADENNLMIAAVINDGGETKPLIIQKKSGAYFEYIVNDEFFATDKQIKSLQLVDGNNGYLIDGNNDLFKFKGAVNWEKLTQKASCAYFKDPNNGYAALGGKIYQTADGGTHWQEVFTAKNDETITAITGKGNKVWAVGNKANQAFIIKYNP
jgi:hypothetical protein